MPNVTRKTFLPVFIGLVFVGHLVFAPTSSAFLNLFEQRSTQKNPADLQTPISPLSEGGREIKNLWMDFQNSSTNKKELILAINEQKAALESEKERLLSKIKNPLIEDRFNRFIAHYESEQNKLLDQMEEGSSQALNESIRLVFGEDREKQPNNSTPFQIGADEELKEIPFSQLSTIAMPTMQKRTAPFGTSPLAPVLSLTASELSVLEELAEELDHNPVEIFNYVYTTISTTPYYGKKKGAYNTYLEKTGNDMDTALLLQALLEASGFETHLIQAQILLTPEQAQRLVGVNDVRTAAQHLLNTGIPVAMAVDALGEPVYVLKEHAWVEVSLPYQNYRGLVESGDDYEWVPLDASLKESFASQELNAPDAMDFNSDEFFEDYLTGATEGTPIEALQSAISTFLSESDYSYLNYEDVLTQKTRQAHRFEFLPNTLPYPIVEILEDAETFGPELTHELSFSVKDSSDVSLLDTRLTVEELANKQVVLGFAPATSADQEVIDLYGSIYLTPPYLIEVKPQLRVNGETVAEGSATPAAGAIEFTMDFLAPRRELWEDIETQNIETINLNSHAGNDIAIALNTDVILSPELFPEAQESGEFWNDQKLYRTALNYLKRVEANQIELGDIFGGTFTNEATRAFVFNGVDVTTLAGVPESFDWKGLRIDSSAVINYASYFGDISSHKKDFTMLFGLAASLDESAIFEEDFDVEAMSTVKGIRLINQGLIPGVSIVKLDAANRSSIDALDLSESTKNTFRSSIDDGKIIYTPTSSFTYLDWTGLVYLTLNPENGDGGYTIGEGLNGGHTVEEWSFLGFVIEEANEVRATIVSPTDGATVYRGDSVYFRVDYEADFEVSFLFWSYTTTYRWTEDGFYGDGLDEGTYPIRSGYETNEEVFFEVIESEDYILEKFIEELNNYVDETGNYNATNYVCISLLIDKIRAATGKLDKVGRFDSTVDSTKEIPDAGADGFKRNVFPYRNWLLQSLEAPFHFQDAVSEADFQAGNIMVYDWTVENDPGTDNDDEYGSDGYWDHVAAVVDIDPEGNRTFIYSTGKGGIIKRVSEAWILERLAGYENLFESLSAAERESQCQLTDADDNDITIIPGEAMLLEPVSYSSSYPDAYACLMQEGRYDSDEDEDIDEYDDEYFNVSDYVIDYVRWSDTVLY